MIFSNFNTWFRLLGILNGTRLFRLLTCPEHLPDHMLAVRAGPGAPQTRKEAGLGIVESLEGGLDN